MTELMASVCLNEWLYQNKIPACEFVSFVCHKTNNMVYGGLFKTDNGLVFQRHKWTEINKGGPLPRVCAEMQYTHKQVGDDFWDSFEKITQDDYYNREKLDIQNV